MPSPTSTRVPTPDAPATLAPIIPAQAGPLDLDSYCRKNVDPDAVAQQAQNPREWLCIVGSDQVLLAGPAFEDVCDDQYGEGSEAVLVEEGAAIQWRCVFAGDSAADGCPHAAGAFSPGFGEVVGVFASLFQVAFESEGGVNALGCPVVLMHVWQGGVLQELRQADADGREWTGAIMASQPDRVVILTGAAWDSWDRVRALPADLLGYPSSEPGFDDATQSWVVPLTAGGVLIAPAERGPFHFMVDFAIPLWVASGGAEGCVGYPVAEPQIIPAGFRQLYQRGSMSLVVGTEGLVLQGDDGSECGLLPWDEILSAEG